MCLQKVAQHMEFSEFCLQSRLRVLGRTAGVPQAANHSRAGGPPLLERLQNQQMVAASPEGEAGGTGQPQQVPSACRGPGRCAGRAFPAGSRDRGVVPPHTESLRSVQQGLASMAREHLRAFLLSCPSASRRAWCSTPPAHAKQRPNTTTLLRRTQLMEFLDGQ